jgi:hypothetical protein
MICNRLQEPGLVFINALDDYWYLIAAMSFAREYVALLGAQAAMSLYQAG